MIKYGVKITFDEGSKKKFISDFKKWVNNPKTKVEDILMDGGVENLFRTFMEETGTDTIRYDFTLQKTEIRKS